MNVPASDPDSRNQAPALLPRGPAALPPDVVQVVQRQRILIAMGQAVAENGYVATSIADIVARARVSRSAFYACFPDKEACFLAGYEAEAERHFNLIASAAFSEIDWMAQLRSAVRVYVRELEQNPGFARSFLIEIVTAGPRALELRAAVHERYAALMKDWYERAPSELGLRPLPDEVYRAAVGANNELAIARLEKGFTAAAQELEDLILYSLLSLFGLTDAAGAALDAVSP
jgi:AcrR family transcriptional regulator